LAKTPFFEHYVTTSLSTKKNENKDEVHFLSRESFLSTQMTLALREDDLDLYEKLTHAIRAKGKRPYCSDLLPSKD
jgi:hypothetical protein